jgi:hypothetical protein
VILPNELGAAIAEELHHMLMRQPGRIAPSDAMATPIDQLIGESLTVE